MFALEVNNTFFVEQKQVLEQALSTNPKTQAALRKLIQTTIKDARDEVVSRITFANGDPRGAAHSVRRTVYKKILGANINIYNSRKAGKPTTYEPPRKLQPHQRGGNRVTRGARTDTVMRYGPNDRGWVLRIVNSGTADRTAGTRGGTLHGNRGSIAARNFFSTKGMPAMEKAVDNLANLIDTELYNILNKKKK